MYTVFNRSLVFVFIGLLFTGANAQYRHNVPTTRIKDTMAQSQGNHSLHSSILTGSP